jgi:23S rRNA pseudouridine2605 synthase
VPPRYAYWTILIDDKATAFRAREREELQPTFAQLQRKNANVTMRWFARGKLWESREAEREDFQLHKQAPPAPRERRTDRPEGAERRGSDWRPGGAHKDPRDRFKKKNRPERAWSEKDPATQRDRDKPGYVGRPPAIRPEDARRRSPDHRGSSDHRASGGGGFRPTKPGSWRDKPAGPPRGDRPWQDKPSGDSRWSKKPSGAGQRPWTGKPRDRKPWSDKPSPPNDRPWQTKPTGPRAQRKPWVGKPSGDAPRGDRPWNAQRPSGEKRPWTPKPSGPPRGDRPWSAKPPVAGDRKPWQKKPFRPGGPPKPDARDRRTNPRKRRDDEPPDRD